VAWTRVAAHSDFAAHADADAFFYLLPHPQLSLPFATAKPVFINSMTVCLSEMGDPENMIRINGWPTFIQRKTWEAAGKINDEVKKIAAHLTKEIIAVADEPGLVAGRVIAMIVNEAYFAEGDKVSSREEIDTAMKLGTNYPLGPFEWSKKIGLHNIYALLNKLSLTDARYTVAPTLADEAKTTAAWL